MIYTRMLHDHKTIGVCHVITSPDHMTKCRDLIYHNLLEFTSFLDCSQSIYILKELVRLHQKLLTCSFPERCESLPIHSSLLKLFQSDIFIKSAQSWFGSLSSSVSPTKVQCHGAQTIDSTAAANEQGMTLKSSLISIVVRKEVLLILHYLVSVLTPDQVATSPTQDQTAGKVIIVGAIINFILGGGVCNNGTYICVHNIMYMKYACKCCTILIHVSFLRRFYSVRRIILFSITTARSLDCCGSGLSIGDG